MLLTNAVFNLVALFLIAISFFIVFRTSRFLRSRIDNYILEKRIDHSSGMQIVILVTIIPLFLLWLLGMPAIILIISSENVDPVDYLLGFAGLFLTCSLGLYWGWGEFDCTEDSISKKYYGE